MGTTERSVSRTTGTTGPDPDFDRVLFHSPDLTVGSFRAAPAHPRFEDSGPAAGHLFVFPRSAVAIQHEGRPAFVAGPPIVTFYNRGQRYRRARVAPEGDRCEWFALSPALLESAVAELRPSGRGTASGPFPFSHGPCEGEVYFRQRRFVDRCLGIEPPDALTAEDVAMTLARRVFASARAAWSGAAPARGLATSRRERDLVEHAKEILLLRFRDALSVTDVARAVGCTPFHLCRQFRRATGWRLHQFRDQVRLRVALEAVRARRGELTDLALDLGYSSHSHFTASFRRAFGVPPTALRR